MVCTDTGIKLVGRKLTFVVAVGLVMLQHQYKKLVRLGNKMLCTDEGKELVGLNLKCAVAVDVLMLAEH